MAENTLFGAELENGVEHSNLRTSESDVTDEQNGLSGETQRLLAVMQREGMNLSQFATAIGIKISSLSHILNGRNNPSLDIMQRTLRRFDYLDADWLILGRGEIPERPKNPEPPEIPEPPKNPESPEIPESIKNLDLINQEAPKAPKSGNEESVFKNEHITHNVGDTEIYEENDGSEKHVNSEMQERPEPPERIKTPMEKEKTEIKERQVVPELPQLRSNPHITKIIVYYSDNTFEQFCR